MFIALLFAGSLSFKVVKNKNGEYDEDVQYLVDTILTVLLSKGRIMTEINNISDAIVHCRSGCGLDVPAGPGLYVEMKKEPSYKRLFNDTNGIFFETLKKQVVEASKKSLEGSVVNTNGMHYYAECFTLGGYSLFLNYNIPYKCTVTETGKTCHVGGIMHMKGVDKWDFAEVPSYSWWQNLIKEKIPEWLVKIHGKNMKPFNTFYAIDTQYEFDFSF